MKKNSSLKKKNGRNERELIHCLDCEFVNYERELVLCTALSTSMLAAL